MHLISNIILHPKTHGWRLPELYWALKLSEAEKCGWSTTHSPIWSKIRSCLGRYTWYRPPLPRRLQWMVIVLSGILMLTIVDFIIAILILIQIFFVWNPDSWNRDEGQITNEEQHRDRRSLTTMDVVDSIGPKLISWSAASSSLQKQSVKNISIASWFVLSFWFEGEITTNISISIPFFPSFCGRLRSEKTMIVVR